MKLEFNHAMIYVTDVTKSVEFYAGRLGFRIIEQMEGVYARLRSPQGNTTIALHKVEEGLGIRLYFESRDLDRICERVAGEGVQFSQMPKDMPWGWRHAYLRDPDGYEISLYRAGQKRLSRTAGKGSRKPRSEKNKASAKGAPGGKGRKA